MSWKSIARIQIKFKTEKQAKSMFQALKPETKKSPTHRSKVKISRTRNNLSFTIGAKDTIALRAALNSHLRFVKAWKNIVKLLDVKNLK